MLSIRRSLVAGAACVAMSAGSLAPAQAADLYGPGSLKDAPTSYMPAVTTQPSWYGRIDFAFAHHDTPVMVENGVTDLTSESIDRTWSFGTGIGRNFTQNIRGDITYENRFESEARGTVNGGNFPGVRSFGLSSQVFMANMYYDFANRSRFTPYLGVGLGITRNKTHEGIVSNACGCTGVVEGKTQWSAAAAFMAGVSVALKRPSTGYNASFSRLSRIGLHLDLGYRFLYLGDATTGPVRLTNAGGTTISDDPTVEDIHAHEFRVGLRYEFH